MSVHQGGPKSRVNNAVLFLVDTKNKAAIVPASVSRYRSPAKP